jgi:D-serine deaminase-like pyridoxal phosphate-dependent protein
MLVVDHPRNAEDLNDAARGAEVIVRVVIDLHVGKKGGIPTGEPALALARQVDSLPNLELAAILFT